jgi:transglutaminase-like putative cysteine protease
MKNKLSNIANRLFKLSTQVHFSLLLLILMLVFIHVYNLIEQFVTPPYRGLAGYWSSLKDFLPVTLYMLVGAQICAAVINLLVRKPKLRIPFFVVLFGLAVTVTPVLFEAGVALSPIFNSSVMGPFIFGILAIIVFFIVLSVTRSLVLPIGLILLFLSSYGSRSNPQVLYKVFYGAVVLICGGMIVYYFARLNQITMKQVRKVLNWKYLVFLVLLGGVMFYIASFLIQQFSMIENALSEIRSLQFTLQQQKGTPGQRNPDGSTGGDQNALDYGHRAMILVPKIVGYYRAAHPLYLKTQVYRVDQLSYRLMINPVRPYTNLYPNYHVSSANTKETDKIKMIYAYGADSVVPTTEKVIAFQNLGYSPLTNLLQWPFQQSDQVGFLEYTYGLYGGGRQKTVQPEEPTGNFTSVSRSSRRYDEIAALTRSITKNAKNDFDKAKAIESYLVENYEYTFTPNIKDLNNPVDEFLFETKKGYCTHFATAMSVMLSTIGVQNRMVGGFYSDVYNPELNVYIMLSTDLHSWVEVYVDGYGWVTFDPTTYKLAPGEDPSILTGGRRTLGGFSPGELRAALEHVDPKLDFDNAYERRNVQGLKLAPGGTSLDQIQDEWKKQDQLEKKRKEELKKQQEELKKKIDQTTKTTYFVVYACIGGAVVLGVGYWLYQRYKKRELLKKLRDQKIARSVEKRIYSFYQKRLKLPKSVLLLSHKKFISYMSEHEIDEVGLRKCFALIDQVLYAQNYKPEDLKMLKKEAADLISREKQKK